MPVTATAIAAGVGVLKAGIGYAGEKKAEKKAAELAATRPKASVNPNITANLNLQESELAGGDGAATQAWRDSTDSALAGSINAILKGGGVPNNVSDVFANNDQGRQRFAQFKDQLRTQKIANYSNALGAEAQEQEKVFDYNSRQWFDEAQANAQQKKDYNQLLFSGISDVAGAGISGATMANANAQTDKMFKFQEKMYDKQNTNQVAQQNAYWNHLDNHDKEMEGFSNYLFSGAGFTPTSTPSSANNSFTSDSDFYIK